MNEKKGKNCLLKLEILSVIKPMYHRKWFIDSDTKKSHCPDNDTFKIPLRYTQRFCGCVYVYSKLPFVYVHLYKCS